MDIVLPEKEIFTGKVESLSLSAMLGSITILVQHAPIVSSLKAGTLAYVTKDGEERALDIHGGCVEMNSIRVSVCID